MTPDIFTSLQTYTDTQTAQRVAGISSGNSDSQPGIFASLMDEMSVNPEVISQTLLPVNPESLEQVMTFTDKGTFVQSIIDILASETDNAEILPESEEESMLSPEKPEDDDVVIWPEDETQSFELGRVVNKLAARVKDIVSGKLQSDDTEITELDDIAEELITEEGLDELPEVLREEISHAINDISAGLKHEDGKDIQPIVKLLDELSERIAPKAPELPQNSDAHEDSDSDSELPESAAEYAALAGITNTAQNVLHTSSRPQHENHIHVQTRPNRDVPVPEQPQTPETRETTQTFREVFTNRETPQEDSGQDQTGNQSQSQGFSQPQGREDSSRSRTNIRRLDSRTQNDETASSPATTTRRTDSRSDFAAYFEGVLTSRRTASRTPATPLDLRGTENFSQSSVVRDGIVNVVRFIRADGVQKARVVIDPPALGRISVELTSGTSGVEASIKVSSEQIRQLVQDQISQLRMNLSQQGVQVAEFTVDVQQDSSGNQNQQGQQQNNPYMNFVDDDDDETEEFRVDLEEGLLYWVA